MADKYIEYFNIDKDFFRCIDQEAICMNPELWKKTYPHPTFVDLLKNVERMLAGSKSPVWVHGAYGTGKSQCAYALKRILEAPEVELREYWDDDRYKHVLQTNANKDLLSRLLGHKERKIVVTYRYASGGINGTRDLLLAVQDSVKAALVEAGVAYQGENTLRDSVIAWLEDPLNKKHFDEYLQLPEFSSRFSQSTADEVLKDLNKGGELKELMENIFYLSDKRGITAFELNTDRLIEWLKDIIKKNEIKIVLIWDEFSSYFKNNRNSLDEFQKIASLAQSTAFYFVIVTHQTSSVITNSQDQAWKVVQQRYEFTEITLPDSIAFDLIGSALEVNPAAKTTWGSTSSNLYALVPESSRAVMQTAGITNTEVIKKIMPLHPYAAMVLKYIATAFEANQRSMFDFIKTADNEDVEAFQWFISNTASDGDRPLLTVDLLWNFFYEKGRNNLTADIQSILDTYPRQQNLSKKEQSVLKTILIIQAIDQRTGNQIELFRLIDKNLSLAFEGISELEGNAAISIAKKLVNDGVLIKRKIGNNQEVYAVVALAGDQAKIEKNKSDLRSSLTTAKLIAEGDLASVLSLTPALKLRFDIEPPNGKLLTASAGADFTRLLTSLKDKDYGWRFVAVLCFAKDDTEVPSFRKAIAEAAANDDYKHIIFIDALSTPLGADAVERYVEFQAMSMYYSGNDKDLAKKYAKDARNILDTEWKNSIERGAFIVYSSANRAGERHPNATGVIGALQSFVVTKYKLIMDFNKGLTERMLKLSQGKASAKHGALVTSGNDVANIEKYTLDVAPNSVWKVDRYWEQPVLSALPISKIKIALEKKINDAFENSGGQVSIRDLYNMLEEEFGFSQSNLSAFLAGFLLKEYCNDTYRFIDNTGKPFENVSKEETLAFMLSDYIGNSNLAKYKDTYIARMTADEKAFYSLSEKAFDILPDSCSTVGIAAISVGKKMTDLGLPIWVLSEIDEFGVYDVVEKYIALVQKEGAEAQQIAIEIGKLAQVKSTLGENLKRLITKENCQNGIREYLKTFEGGKILDLARDINAEANLIDDIRRLFSVERSRLWIKTTGEEEIRKLLTEYGVARETNSILSANTNSLKTALAAWRDRLKFVHVSAEGFKIKYPHLVKLIDFMAKIYGQTELLHEQYKTFLAELQSNGTKFAELLNDEKSLFIDIYSPYLDGLDLVDVDDVGKIIGTLPVGMFSMTASECNIKVRDKADEFRKGQLKVKLFALWKDRTNTATPKQWSSKYSTPILALVVGDDYDKAKKTFETLNQTNPPEFAIKDALAYLDNASFFEDLQSVEKRDEAFVKYIIGSYSKMLTTAKVRERLERLTIEAYDWFSHPAVQAEVKKLAEAEYFAGGSDTALSILGKMTDNERDVYIKRLVKENAAVGIEIITRGGI
ncbi:MAG: hypothetical protein FNP40_15715 [Dehalobacter sp. 4CP]|uniref:hypothetical protein n=1 Tax=Dehalobacter sp. CP TaxID=2594474 RepID=UPI0013CAE458|nr:hypothetical protein [Dehalobacter sp. 4CP]